jgi:hypothetical protein
LLVAAKLDISGLRHDFLEIIQKTDQLLFKEGDDGTDQPNATNMLK